MPKTAKTPANAVRTTDRYSIFVLGALFDGSKTNGLKSGQSGYTTVKQEMNLTIESVFRVKKERMTRVFAGYSGQNEYNGYRNDKGGLAIGCMNFSLTATKKIARWAGFSASFVRRYIG